MKRSEIFFSVLLLPIDAVAMVAAALVAYYIRFETNIFGIREVFYELPLAQYFKLVLLATPALLFIYALSGLYAQRTTRRGLTEFSRVIVATSIGALLLIVLIFFQRELFSSRFIILAAWVLTIIFVYLARFAVHLIQRSLFKKGIGIHRVAIVGEGEPARRAKEAIKQNPNWGFRVTAEIDPSGEPQEIFKKLKNLQLHDKIDEVLEAATDLSRQTKARLVDYCEERHLDFRFTPDLFGTQATNVNVEIFSGTPIVELKRTPLDGWGRVAKRLLDIIGSSILITITSPVMLVAAIAIKLDSRGPVIYKNRRVGRDGEFNTLKFRSMKAETCTGKQFNNEKALALEKKLIAQKDARQGGPLYKIKDDPRLTRIGKFIRKTSLDELPQLFNVFWGQMSLVGPRPHQPREVAKYKKHHRKVLSIKPGITGMAHVSGWDSLDFEDEVRLDTYYIENWSIFLDISLIFKTPFILLRRKSAI